VSAVLDSSVLIDVLRSRSPAVDYLLSLSAPPVCSEVTRIEILRGMRSNERSPTHRLLGSLAWQPVDDRVAELARELGRRYLRSHTGIDLADLCVAATATLLDLPLATANVKHYPMFPDLVPPY
jgi:predicted nucleic acid-binding protein